MDPHAERGLGKLTKESSVKSLQLCSQFHIQMSPIHESQHFKVRKEFKSNKLEI
jgi:hypothetical protein